MSRSSPSSDVISDGVKIMTLYRALESERPDALFQDPYARLLAGDSRQEITEKMVRGSTNGWTIAIRTKVFDELIYSQIEHGVEVFLHLGAGLDTRPYRLHLPSHVHWIEVERAEILAYKREKLGHVQPTCSVEQKPCNIHDRGERQKLLVEIAREHGRVCVIAEGLLVYLTAHQAAELAMDLYEQKEFQWWLISLSSPYLLQKRKQSWQKQIATSKEPPKFAPQEGAWFFERYGWQVREARYTLTEARRLKRHMPRKWWESIWDAVTLKEKRERARKQGGYILLERS